MLWSFKDSFSTKANMHAAVMKICEKESLPLNPNDLIVICGKKHGTNKEQCCLAIMNPTLTNSLPAILGFCFPNILLKHAQQALFSVYKLLLS
jgi:hypothetical protein